MTKTVGRITGIPFIAVLIAFVLVVSVIGITLEFWLPKTDGVKTVQDERLTVVTTLFPYYDMARSIAGDRADIHLLLPPGIGPHHFEPRPSDIQRLRGADVFIYTGSFLEPWAGDLLESVQNPDLVVVNASEHAIILLVAKETHPGIDAESDEGTVDPHIWLDFDNMINILKAVRDALVQADPSGADIYQEHALLYESDVKLLDTTYRNTFDQCRTRTFVHGGHRSFGYIARRYNLEYFSTTGVMHEEEATAGELAGLITLVKEKALPYVFYDAFESPRTAEVIAKESSSGILTLHSAANVDKRDFDEGVTFFDIMEANLKNLSLALECQ